MKSTANNYRSYGANADTHGLEHLFEKRLPQVHAALQNANMNRQAAARAKIDLAVKECLQQGRQISRNKLVALTGCSVGTVRRHADLWKHLSIGTLRLCQEAGIH